MKVKLPRPSHHRSQNTHNFKGFGEKVRALRVSARNYLLQRPLGHDGSTITNFHQVLVDSRDLNLTQGFQAFQCDLGGDLQTTAQLLVQDSHVAQCLANHMKQVDAMSLQPLLNLLVAFANDLPQEFYHRHFYTFLKILVSRLKTREPEEIQAVFLCLVSIIVAQQKYLRDDLYRLYHSEHYANLLSSNYPWYINELAGQSLAFLLRKLPNKATFWGMAFRKLHVDPKQTQGVGRLLASTLKSDVIQRLHSTAKDTLTHVLKLLGEEDIPREQATESVIYAVTQVAHHITSKLPDKSVNWQTPWKDDSHMMWPAFWDIVDSLISDTGSSEVVLQHLHAVLQVLQVLVGYKGGALVTDVLATLTHCLTIIQTPGISEEINHILFIMVAKLLTKQDNQFTTSTLKQTVSVVLASNNSQKITVEFIKKLFGSPLFDTEILPLVLQYLTTVLEVGDGEDTEMDILEILSSFVLQRQPPCKTGMDVSSWRCYPLDFSLIQAKTGGEGGIPKILERKLSAGLVEDLSNIEELVICLLCLPHVAPLNYQDQIPNLVGILSVALGTLNDQIEKIVNKDTSIVDRKAAKAEAAKSVGLKINLNIKQNMSLDARRSLVLLSVLTESMAHIFNGKDFLASLSQLQLLEVLKQKPQYRENVHFLKALDFYITIAAAERDSSIISEDFLKDFYPLVAPCLVSAKPQVRLLAIHMLSLFPVTLPSPPEDTDPAEGIFQVMLKAESVAVTPWEYKDRLRYLTMLDADHVEQHQPVCGTYKLAPLLFFLGQLYINYKDLWTPVLNAITTFAQTLPDQTFWPIWFSHLKIASQIRKQVLNGKKQDSEKKLFPSNEIVNAVALHVATHDGFSQLSSRPDHLSYQELLWKAMEKFSSVCEAKGRDLVPLFFETLEQELLPVDFIIAPTQNLKFRKSDGVVNETAEDTVAADLEEQKSETLDTTTEISAADEESRGGTPQGKRVSVKLLCAILSVFARFHNPKVLYQTKKLENMYLELLSHPSPMLQKHSLECLMTYNFPHLTPYRENLFKILDGKSFKNALTLFSIDGSEQLVEEDHREGLMPYLMRILYGKMHFKTGSKSSRKSNTGLRKAVILRFLAGARESELDTFLNLAFDILKEHLHGTAMDMVVCVREKLDLHRVVPLRKLQGALTTLKNIIEKIGNLLSDKIPFLLKVLLYILHLVTTLLEQREDIRRQHVNFLKHLRMQAQQLLMSCFTQFEKYSWSLPDLEAVFEVMVWPNLKQLPADGVLSLVPLLKLFYLWSENPRFMPLLAWCHPDDVTFTPLPYIVKLLCHKKCSTVVSSYILSLVENLLTIEDSQAEEESEQIIPLPDSPNRVEVVCQTSQDGERKQTYGMALLTPHLNPLLSSMKYILSKLRKGQPVSNRDLTILTSLTEWVSSKDISSDLVSLIVPMVAKKQVGKEERIAQLLTTCKYLLPNTENSDQYLPPLVSQFAVLAGRHTRETLCQCVSAIAVTNEQCQPMATIANDLNAWHPRMIEEPDYERRLQCYQSLTEYFGSQESIDMNLCQLVMYNCVFFITKTEDSSLRDLSSQSLVHLIDFCARLHGKEPAECKQVISANLIPQIRLQLRNDKELVRMEMLSIFRHTIRRCHSFTNKLQDLYKLVDETDDDLDFFLNWRHIQKHRRARALSKLADILTNGKFIFTTETLTSYLMPLATVYLMKDAYANDDYLITCCISCLGAIARLLPWHSYHMLLKNYLSLMMKENLKHLRQGVRILDTVIEAFHEEVQMCDAPKQKTSVKDGNGDKQEKSEEENMKEERQAGQELEEASVKKELEKGTEKEKDEVKMEEGNEEDPNEDHKQRRKGKDAATQGTTRAQKVYSSLVNTIIPQIQNTLAARTKADMEHKVNKSNYPEDEDIKRIPLAFALVKLLKKLPRELLNTNINNVLMKMITFLKSKSDNIREEARIMLVKIMEELGGRYLKWLVSDLQTILTRGYQTHVLVYTLFSVLSSMRSILTPDDVDPCMSKIIDICKEDILGLQAEEKEVKQITGKVKEARKDKGYEILCFTAEFISTGNLKEIILPLKEILADTQDKVVVNKMARCFGQIAKGLDRNNSITITQKSVFIYGILSEKLSDLTKDKNTENSSAKKTLRADSFLLAPEPKRAKLNPKTSLNTTGHTVMEFALNFLCSLIRRERFSVKEDEHLSLLDPFMPVAGKFIDSDHPEVSIVALKCIRLLINFPLPSVKTGLATIISRLFVIIHKFSSPELARGKVYDLVQLSFNTLSSIIRREENCIMREEDVRMLVEYASHNLEDVNQQKTAFTILQAVIARKIDNPELHMTMLQVRRMAINSNRVITLQEARVTYYPYLLTYPMKRRTIIGNISFFLTNINYPVVEGRYSAITMISSIIANFPSNVFDQALETTLWFKISEQLVNEDSKENRVLLEKALKTLFRRSTRREMLVELSAKLLHDDTQSQPDFVACQVACQALSTFLEVPVKLLPQSLLSVVTPAVISLINPENYSALLEGITNDDSLDTRQTDTALVWLLEVLTKLVDVYFSRADWSKHASDEIWQNVQAQLRYPHLQVRLNASILVGKLLAAYPVEKSASPKFAEDTSHARSLVLDLCDLLQTQASSPTPLLTKLSLSVVRNLIYLIRHASKVTLRIGKANLLDDEKNVPKRGRKSEKAKEEDAGESGNDDDENEHMETSDASECANERNGSRKRKMSSHSTKDEQNKRIRKDESMTIDPTISGAMWVLHRVGNMAYEELHAHGKEKTVVRGALLNLIAGLVVILRDGIKTPQLLTYLIKHLARELSDEHLPEALANRTQQVAKLIKEKVGLQTYTQHLTSARTKLSQKRLQRRANELQLKTTNPVLAQHKKRKKHEALKESRKRRLADRRGKVIVKGKQPGPKGKVTVKKKSKS